MRVLGYQQFLNSRKLIFTGINPIVGFFLNKNPAPMSTQSAIEHKLQDSLSPLHLEVHNESNMHNVPEGSESHFKIIAVSEVFEGKLLLARHRMINQLLANELSNGIHALTMHTMTPQEWFDKGGNTPDSPPCMGGSEAK